MSSSNDARCTDRHALLEEQAGQVGTGWARACRDELVREGRVPAGGWPGTLGEARNRVALGIGVELRRRKLPTMTNDELGAAAKVAYRAAKREWLEHAAAAE